MTVTETSAAEPLPLMGALLRPLAAATDTADAFEAFRLDLVGGARSPRHALPAAKLFVVLEGEVLIGIGDAETAQVAGAVVLVLAGTPHWYRATGAAALAVVTAGTGQLAFLAGVSTLAAGGAPDPQRMRELAGEHGVTLLPPA